MANALASRRHTHVERPVYRLLGVNPDSEPSTRTYVLGVLGFSVVSLVGLCLILVAQSHLPYARGMDGMSWGMAFNTAASLVTNTNWLLVRKPTHRRPAPSTGAVVRRCSNNVDCA